MARLAEILAYTDQLLGAESYQDYCPNGLQVQGREEVGRLVTGVTACAELLERAIASGADAVLVHHGYFWKGEDPRIIGMKQRRLRALLTADVSLLAYHLPLDGHPELGNNAQLGAKFGFEVSGHFGRDQLGCYTELASPLAPAELVARLDRVLDRKSLWIAARERPLSRIGWCSGAAQGFLEDAAALGLDAFISGEVSEPTVHAARELDIHYIAAGHHATERFGVQALGRHLSERFKIEHHFIDVPNPA